MIETSKKEVCEVMNKYGKVLAGQGYPIGSAKFILQTEEGVFATKVDADFENITEDDIEKLWVHELPIHKGEMKAIVYSQTPHCQQCLKEAKPFPAMLDDMAQIFGPACYIVDGREGNDSRGKSLFKALKDNVGCLVLKGFSKNGEGVGYTITMGRNLYEAVVATTVLEKSAEVFLLAEKLGGGKPIPKWEAKLMRMVYKKKYSKAEEKVKASEVK
ncbi:MAG: hypothetical protein IKU53_04830 [Firmicutes bacterium]|nr:hypothetical protein [Bacillota bacterium]